VSVPLLLFELVEVQVEINNGGETTQIWLYLDAEVLVLAFTRYCHYQYCVVYSIQSGDRGGVVSWATDVQWYCNSAGNSGGRGQSKDD